MAAVGGAVAPCDHVDAPGKEQNTPSTAGGARSQTAAAFSATDSCKKSSKNRSRQRGDNETRIASHERRGEDLPPGCP